MKQETVSGIGISLAICKFAPRSRQITTPGPHHSVFYRPDALPATQPTASKHWSQIILLEMTYKTGMLPSDLASIVCSRVCPPASNPVSNSPLVALTTSTATSACAAPACQAKISTSQNLWFTYRDCYMIRVLTVSSKCIATNVLAKLIFQDHTDQNQDFFRTNSQFQDFYRPEFSFFRTVQDPKEPCWLLYALQMTLLIDWLINDEHLSLTQFYTVPHWHWVFASLVFPAALHSNSRT